MRVVVGVISTKASAYPSAMGEGLGCLVQQTLVNRISTTRMTVIPRTAIGAETMGSAKGVGGGGHEVGSAVEEEEDRRDGIVYRWTAGSK